MKKTLSILLLLIPFLAVSQTKKPIDGFWGIKFGIDSTAVKATVLAKGGIMDPKHSQPDFITFSNINYETWKNLSLSFNFCDNKAYKI